MSLCPPRINIVMPRMKTCGAESIKSGASPFSVSLSRVYLEMLSRFKNDLSYSLGPFQRDFDLY